MAWLTNWNYRKPVTISNTGSVLSDYQVLVTIDTLSLATAGKMRSDCADIRLTISDGSSLIYYWIESGCNTSSTKIWVKIPSISSGTTTIYLYYGNVTPPSDGYGSSLTGTFGTSTATSAIPGCTLGQACIISSNRTISASGTYGHPYIRIDPGVTLTIDGPGVIAYFDSIGRFDIQGTLRSTGGGNIASNGGTYWGTGSGGNGGTSRGGNLGGGYGGGGASYSGGVGSYGGGGQNGDHPGGKGAFLSIKSNSIINLTSGGSISLLGSNGCCDTNWDSGGGGGALLEMRSSPYMILNGSISVVAGRSGNGDAPGAGGGALSYIDYTSVIGTGSITVTAGNRGSGPIGSATGGDAKLITPSETQEFLHSGATGGTINKTFTAGGSEPTFSALGTEEGAAFITAIDPMIITTSQTPCLQGICTVTVTVTWQNQGTATGSFVPSLTIDGSPIAPQYPSENLGPGATVTHAFSITTLAIGTHEICPNPN